MSAPLGRGEGQRPYRARADVGGCGGEAVDHARHHAGDHVGGRLGAAAIGDVGEVRAGRLRQPQAEQVRHAADAGRGVFQPLRPASRLRHVLGHARRRKARVDHQQVGRAEQHGDVGEVAIGVPLDSLAVERIADGHTGDCGKQERIAVGRRGGDQASTESCASAATVFHHDGLAEEARHLISHETADDVRGATGAKWDDKAYGPAGPRHLGECRGGERRDQCSAEEGAACGHDGVPEDA